MTRVGWVGLGAMGSPMARCVARAGYKVAAYDIDPGRAASLAADGVKPAASITEVAAAADVLVLMVATPGQVEGVLFGDDPAAPALAPGTVVLVMATVGPAAVQRWADRLAEQQVHVVDAPVSGGVARAAAGELLVMVGGPQTAVERVQPLLDAMAGSAPVVGSAPGDGQKVKLVNQLLCGVHIAVAAEALAFAEAMHLDPAATWEVIRGGAAASFMLDDRGERMVHGSDEIKSALDIFVKDMGLVLDAARASSYPAPLASAAAQLYLAGRRAGLGRRDDSAVIEILRGGPSPASDDGGMKELSASELADLAGVTEAEVGRLVGLGILVARDGAGPFLATDVQKVRLATACEQAGLPMDGIAAAIRAGRLSFAFVEAAPYRRWAVRSGRTYRAVSEETGIPLELLGSALESMGFVRMAPDEAIREDELEVVPLLQRGLSSGLLDLAWLARIGRAHVEGLRLIATAWGEAYQARFEGPVLASGADQRTAMEQAAQLSVDFLPVADPALLAIYRRQQELVWTEGLVERIENELERAGMLGRSGRVPAMCFLDLVGYTRLTEERGDAAAAALAEALAVLVNRTSREHGGVPVKWLGDGVMVHFRDPAGAVLSALGLVAQLPAAGLPPAHVGVAAGPVVVQGGDYFGRTVNLAARIAASAGAGQVLVSQSVAESAPPEGVRFVELEELRLEGFARPVRLLEARRT